MQPADLLLGQMGFAGDPLDFVMYEKFLIYEPGPEIDYGH